MLYSYGVLAIFAAIFYLTLKIRIKLIILIFNHMIKKYNLINNICGWFAFLAAAIVYLMTIEPSASFWDCGEFITSAYKFEVGHPPGAPFFMLTGKFFSLFASDPSHVAAMINSMSALMSALTILFLFWTITHLSRKLICKNASGEMSLGQLIIIMGCGLVGALTYTFTDTFWFSAVEGEVYAYSSMFTALVFWLILKWENRADQPGSDKWLVIIAYAMGLSIGVHLLNLLCIPAICMVYYFRKTDNPNFKGTLLSLVGSFVLIVILMYGVIPGVTKVGGGFELFFVNTLGMHYNSGVLTYIALLLVSIIWALYETLSKRGNLKRAKIAFVISMVLSGVTVIGSNFVLWVMLIAVLITIVIVSKKVTMRFLNTSVLCLLVILIGYSSFALIPIRSIANTPMDQNSPENVFSLAGYLNREQYGNRPLFYGKTYASKLARDNSGKVKMTEEKKYEKIVKKSPDVKDRYFVASTASSYEYTNSMVFPRMYTSQDDPNYQSHMVGYMRWGGVSNPNIPPTLLDNISFFFNYQLNYMYFRYFMWNFSGRQNDISGRGGISSGNWITGISFIDEHVLGLGPQGNLPPDIAENKGHNVYYMLPFLLGILGIIYQLRNGKNGERQFLVTFLLFFMTGIAIIIYLNQQPFEPRERDYAYAGSFYAYCIWIGLGVAFFWELLRKKLPETITAIVITLVLLFVPIQMASQNWNDHDRSDRYVMRDFGKNYLTGCAPQAILFTMGDNDTFPLWYAQEVEGFRTDVRVCNLSYLQTDWYVDQMRRQAYDSEPLPITWTEDRYIGSKGQSAYVFSRKELENIILKNLSEEDRKWASHINFNNDFDTTAYKDIMPLNDIMQILKTKDNYAPRNPFGITEGVIVPSTKFYAPIDTAKVNWKALGTKPFSNFVIDLGDNKNGIYRQEIMIMEMLNNINKNNWKRPIYYALTIGEFPFNVSKQQQLEGINYRIVPGKVDETGVNTDVMFDNMVNKYKWGGIENPKVYLDETCLRMCRSFRMSFNELVSALIAKNEKDKALIALDKCMEAIPGNTVPRGVESIEFAEAYYILGQQEKARKVISEISHYSIGALEWYASMDAGDMLSSSYEIKDNLSTEMYILNLYQQFDKEKYALQLKKMMAYTDLFMSKGLNFAGGRTAHPLEFLMNVTMRNLANEEKDTTAGKQAEWQQIAAMMQKYKPDLLLKYFDVKGK